MIDYKILEITGDDVITSNDPLMPLKPSLYNLLGDHDLKPVHEGRYFLIYFPVLHVFRLIHLKYCNPKLGTELNRTSREDLKMLEFNILEITDGDIISSYEGLKTFKPRLYDFGMNGVKNQKPVNDGRYFLAYWIPRDDYKLIHLK